MRQDIDTKNKTKSEIEKAEAQAALDEQAREDEEDKKMMASEKMEYSYWDRLNEQRLFDPNEYFVKGNPALKEESAWISLSVEYQTRLENVKGVLTL